MRASAPPIAAPNSIPIQAMITRVPQPCIAAENRPAKPPKAMKPKKIGFRILHPSPIRLQRLRCACNPASHLAASDQLRNWPVPDLAHTSGHPICQMSYVSSNAEGGARVGPICAASLLQNLAWDERKKYSRVFPRILPRHARQGTAPP